MLQTSHESGLGMQLIGLAYIRIENGLFVFLIIWFVQIIKTCTLKYLWTKQLITLFENLLVNQWANSVVSVWILTTLKFGWSESAWELAGHVSRDLVSLALFLMLSLHYHVFYLSWNTRQTFILLI
jgi:hypothetical protein